MLYVNTMSKTERERDRERGRDRERERNSYTLAHRNLKERVYVVVIFSFPISYQSLTVWKLLC